MGYRCDNGRQAGAEENAGEITGQERRREQRDTTLGKEAQKTIPRDTELANRDRVSWDSKQVQEFLGHEKASTTLDIYSHVSLEGKKNTAVVLDELLAEKSA